MTLWLLTRNTGELLIFPVIKALGEIVATAILGRKMAPETGPIMTRLRINLVTDSSSTT